MLAIGIVRKCVVAQQLERVAEAVTCPLTVLVENQHGRYDIGGSECARSEPGHRIPRFPIRRCLCQRRRTGQSALPYLLSRLRLSASERHLSEKVPLCPPARSGSYLSGHARRASLPGCRVRRRASPRLNVRAPFPAAPGRLRFAALECRAKPLGLPLNTLAVYHLRQIGIRRYRFACSPSAPVAQI